MTNREKEIYQFIKENTLINQQELATLLNITRSSVGVHISNLIKKGYIKGKGYVTTNQEKHCLVIGGAHVELEYKIRNKSKQNLGCSKSTSINVGGSGKEAAREISKFGISTKFITVLGNDVHSDYIIKEIESNNIDFNDSLFLKGSKSATHISIFDTDNRLEVSLVSDEVYESLTSDFIIQKNDIIRDSSLIILDTYIPIDTIEFILKTFKNKTFFLNVVPSTKIESLRESLKFFHTLKISKDDLEKILELKFENDIALVNSINQLLFKDKLNEIFITLGSNEIYHFSKQSDGTILSKKFKTEKEIMAFSAMSYLKGVAIEDI